MSAGAVGERMPVGRPVMVIGTLLAVLGATCLLLWPPPGQMFSAWMAAHLLLSYAAAPLLVLALQTQVPVPPLPAFVAFNAVTILLHLPAVHVRLMALPGGLWLAGALFLATGPGLWQSARTLPSLSAAALLGAQMAACALTGALVTFTHGAAYHAPDTDVMLGGVLMWVAGGLVPMATTLALLVAYLKGNTA